MALGTLVQIQIASSAPTDEIEQAMQTAMEAIQAVEGACSRFDTDSELRRLLRVPIGQSVEVSPILFQSIQFACEVARWTDGRFDPTIASRLEELGFVHHYLTGESVQVEAKTDPAASYLDIELDADNQTVCLHRPLHLDLGAVAKGLAVDLAVKELSEHSFNGFVVDAGGDIYAAGTGAEGKPWTIDIRHPVHLDEAIQTLQVSNAAVCTSGTYERRSPLDQTAHHILNAQDRLSTQGVLSLTAVGPFTMMTDALSTAAFLYETEDALQLLEEAGLEGMVVTEDLQIELTSKMEEYFG